MVNFIKKYKKWIILAGVGIGLIVFFGVKLVRNGGVEITSYQWLKEVFAGTYTNNSNTV